MAWEPKLHSSCLHPKLFLSLADLCDVLMEMTLSGTPPRCPVLLVRRLILGTARMSQQDTDAGSGPH